MHLAGAGTFDSFGEHSSREDAADVFAEFDSSQPKEPSSSGVESKATPSIASEFRTLWEPRKLAAPRETIAANRSAKTRRFVTCMESSDTDRLQCSTEHLEHGCEVTD